MLFLFVQGNSRYAGVYYDDERFELRVTRVTRLRWVPQTSGLRRRSMRAAVGGRRGAARAGRRPRAARAASCSVCARADRAPPPSTGAGASSAPATLRSGRAPEAARTRRMAAAP